MESLWHLTTTNQAPTDDERGRLTETLAGYDEKLNTITHKISKLEEQLRILNEEKTALLEASAPIHRALSPFRQLPEDVVRAIFVACLETRWNPTMANTEAPVLLTRISRATRLIALTTPELWAAIHIPIITSVPGEVVDNPAESIMSRRTEGVKEWLLRRSGNIPLHISVYEKIEYGMMSRSINPEITDDLIDVLTACCFRWKNVHFSCRPTTISHVSSLNHFDVPLLQSLTITSIADSEGEDNFWRDSGILKAPTLKKFRQLVSRPVSIFPLNWPNLTHLYYTQINPGSMNELACVLCQTINLVRLDLTVLESAPISSGTISLLYLTTLVITEYDAIDPPESGFGILGSIHAPSLESIGYNTEIHNIVRAPALIACLSKSPNIQELSIGQPSSLNTLIEYISLCPMLTTLHIPAPRYAFDEPLAGHSHDTFLSALIHDNPGQCLCPQLEYLWFEPKLAVSLHTLRGFLVDRNGTTPGLSRLKAVIMNIVYDPIEEPLIKDIQSVDVARDARLEMSFKKTSTYSRGFDLGINRTNSTVDDWWPTNIVDDMTYLR